MAHQDIPIIGPVLARLVGTRNDRFVKKYTQRVDAINAREADMRKLTDAELRQQVEVLRGRHDEGAKTEELLIDAFAVAREAMDRAVGIRAIFNPAHEFDASRLPESVRALYEETKAAMDATPPAAPEGEFLGHTEELPGWRQLDIPNEIYEAVRELYPQSRPPFRARPFDVQLIGGMVLSQGKIAEMKTGEGKTIVAPLACYLACVERRQVHVVTVNDYLVQRDRDWTFPFFRALGLTVGAIHPHHMQPEDEKRRMYECDVVYGTTSEFGFDYLRDNMKRSAEQQVQKGRHFAVVDEVDSTLIDEARTPLIISGLAHDYRPRYEMADELAQHLVERQKPWTEADGKVNHCKERIKGLEGDIRQSRDRGKVPELQKALAAAKAELPELERERDQYTQFYEVEMDRKQAHLTHEGIAEAQRKAGIGSFYVGENIDVPHLLEQSIRGYAVYQRDKDYIVMDLPNPQTGRNEPGVVIVDANTGRPMIGRQWSDGLHQAVEAKERVPIKQETQTVATITIQNYFKMYKRLSGMTGTADTEAQEFHDIYSLDVVAIPTNRPISRRDFEDLVFLRKKDKLDAIVEEIKAFHDVGRPILVGTTSVEMSETIAKLLQRKHQIQHEVLNAKQHEREANIVEDAGRMGAVMIATNMAGRGTDIKLGPVSRETMLDHWLRRGICSRGLTVDSTVEELRENVYRKVAPQYLEGVHKREAESMDFAELERKLLERWALDHTWLSEKQIASASIEGLREELDATGRFLLHDLRWFDSIEEMGGLHVIGTERHEARRIDNQLRGRSGRQGDNGSSRFFVSLEDDLMAMFAGQTTMRILSRLGMKEGDAIEHPMLSKSVERAQRKVEERNFQMRKNILEYDEVMEHQRQRFYGQRQRVLDGRDVRGLVFGYVEAAVDEAVGEYLDSDYPAQCAAEFAKEKLDCSIMPDRLRNRELMEVEDIVRKEAKQDARQNISVTLGEYMPMEGSEVSVDFDSAGLISWAKSRFGVELDAGELREGGASERRAVEARLEEAAEEQIDAADLSGLAEYTEEHYGAKQLIAWLSRKFTIEATVDEILEAKRVDDDSAIEGEGVADLIVRRVRELYDRREIEYPVDFALEMTMNQMRQDPASAMSRLVDWAKRKYGVELDPETIVKTPPKKVREDLLAVSERFVKDDTLGKTV
ncbi:MAG: preprotein translocase subunit SecA, partial [Planctomycetota bacterium]